MTRAHALALATLLLPASLASAQSYYYPDPASRSFPDPSGPYSHDPYFHQYEYRRPTQTYQLDPRSYDPGYYPDPASRSFPDPSGPYFHSSYLYNYEYRPTPRAFPQD
jgi:hypothetical protein